MIRITDQYFWNFVFSVFFLVLVGMGLLILDTEARLAPADLTWLDVVLITLASQRLVRLFVYDHVTKWFREQFYDAKVLKTKVTLHKPERGPRRTIVTLLSCPWCFGMWATASVAFFYLLTPYAYFPVLLLAVSSLASMVQIGANLLGHKAEYAKYESESVTKK